MQTATCELVLVDSKQSRLHRHTLPVHNMGRTPVRLAALQLSCTLKLEAHATGHIKSSTRFHGYVSLQVGL